MKKIISVLFLSLSLLTTKGQQSSSTSQSKYFVAFCSEEVSKSSAGGHAFITIGKGEPFTCNIDGGDGEAYGLYAADFEKTDCVPSKFNALASYFVGELPGCLFNDIRTSVDNYLVLRCSFEEYLMVQTEIENWKRKTYELKKHDCLTFVIEIAKLFSYRLTIPPRSGVFNNFPNQYMLKLKSLNKGDY
jgi:hypothetical protein